MIALSYITKKFFEELLEKPLDGKKYEHLNLLIKNHMFFFVGNKNNYRKILENKKKYLSNDHNKFTFIKQLLAKSSWINIPIDFTNINNFFKYLTAKDITLDFIYCSDIERKKKIGDLKYLKKSTMNMVISPKRIYEENQKILSLIDKVIESPHTITYAPREKINKVILKKEFKIWKRNLSKLIFVSDETLIYDRYIFQNFVLIKDQKTLYNRNSAAFCKTLDFVSKLFVKSFVSKNDFNCKIICVFPPPEPKKDSHKILKDDENWNFLKNEMDRFIKLNPTQTSISIKDRKLWNKVHERYWQFFKGGHLIKVLKFNPGFDFIKELNFDWNKEKEYEFDNVRELDIYKKKRKFDELLEASDLIFREKSA